MRELIGYFESASEILPSIDINLKPANIFREPEETLEKGLFYSDLFPMETPMRAGTPIKVLEKTSDGKFFKVLILDAREEIRNPESLQANEQFHDLMGYLRVDTPIGKFLDEKDLGQTNDFDMVEFY